MNEESIAVVIPVHNRIVYTLKCIECLKAQYVPIYIVIIDDGSTDNTNDLILSKYPEVKIIKGDGDLWWTRSVNIGIHHILGLKCFEYILVINNDTIVESDYLEKNY